MEDGKNIVMVQKLLRHETFEITMELTQSPLDKDFALCRRSGFFFGIHK